MEFERQYVRVEGLPDAVKAKWPAGVLSEGFVPFPKTFLRAITKIFKGDNGLRELNVILAHIDYKRVEVKRPPTLQYLAYLAGLELVETQAAFDRLKDRGLIDYNADVSGRLAIDDSKLMEQIENICASEP